MATVTVVRVDTLRRRLRAALGADHLLAHRLDRALGARDPVALDAALAVLERHPGIVRAAVQDVVTDWLLGDVAEVQAAIGSIDDPT
jgi:hypothetical protein